LKREGQTLKRLRTETEEHKQEAGETGHYFLPVKNGHFGFRPFVTGESKSPGR
jgi:hypothetical protein